MQTPLLWLTRPRLCWQTCLMGLLHTQSEQQQSEFKQINICCVYDVTLEAKPWRGRMCTTSQILWSHYETHTKPPSHSYPSIDLTLLLDMECESSFKGRGRRSSFPLSKPATEKDNSMRTAKSISATANQETDLIPVLEPGQVRCRNCPQVFSPDSLNPTHVPWTPSISQTTWNWIISNFDNWLRAGIIRSQPAAHTQVENIQYNVWMFSLNLKQHNFPQYCRSTPH